VHRRLGLISTDCQLTWQGITVYGIVDTGVGWQSHGAAFDPKSAVGSSYLIQKQNRGSIWTLAPNALSNSFIGIKGIEPIGGNVSVVFDLDAGFDPYSLQFSNGPGSIAASNGIPKTCKAPTPTQAGRASGTMAKATSASVLRPTAH